MDFKALACRKCSYLFNNAGYYASGKLVEKDPAKAYMYFTIAENHGVKSADRALQLFSDKFTPAQKAEGKKLAAEYEKTHKLDLNQ